jgi:hypothetical protein
MKKYIFIIIWLAVIIFLFRANSLRDWLFIIASVVLPYIVIFMVERYRKLTNLGKYLIFIIVGVPFLAMILPLYGLVIQCAIGLAFIIARDNTTDKTDNTI